MKSNSKKVLDKKGVDGKHSKGVSDNLLKERIEKLEEEIKVLALTIDGVEDEKQEVENQLKKVLADYQNLQSGLEKRMDIRMTQLKKQVGQDLMILMDDLNYGLGAADNLKLTKELEAWMEGMKDTIRKMEKVLAELGIEMLVVNVGDSFDSNRHEAIAVIEHELNNKIVEVVQPGYLIGDLVVRPARVVVGKTS